MKEGSNFSVTVVGLGAMGSALAEALIKNGFAIHLWNRSAEKANRLVAQGGIYHAALDKAVEAGSIIIVCINDYKTTKELFSGNSVKPLLKGKTIVQLSTGTATDAREAGRDFESTGASYLDGAILATPSQIGQEATPIFFSGRKEVFEKHQPVLRALAGNLLYMGNGFGNAAAWDIAVLSALFGLLCGFLHGANLMKKEDIPVDELGNTIASIAPVLGQMVKDTGEDIQLERYQDPQSSISTCAASFELMVRQAKEIGINEDFPNYVLTLFNKAQMAGLGDERIAAIMKILN
jgi:3-hydroxyisobutyrate dehydrogenase-like beta-hydroxyacid dehydrogenase